MLQPPSFPSFLFFVLSCFQRLFTLSYPLLSLLLSPSHSTVVYPSASLVAASRASRLFSSADSPSPLLSHHGRASEKGTHVFVARNSHADARKVSVRDAAQGGRFNARGRLQSAKLTTGADDDDDKGALPQVPSAEH